MSTFDSFWSWFRVPKLLKDPALLTVRVVKQIGYVVTVNYEKTAKTFAKILPKFTADELIANGFAETHEEDLLSTLDNDFSLWPRHAGRVSLTRAYQWIFALSNQPFEMAMIVIRLFRGILAFYLLSLYKFSAFLAGAPNLPDCDGSLGCFHCRIYTFGSQLRPFSGQLLIKLDQQ